MARNISDQTSSTNNAVFCEEEQCGQQAVCSLEQRFFCLAHFISHSYQRLGQCKTSPFEASHDEKSESDSKFLRECAQRVIQLAQSSVEIDNLNRARIYDIFLWACELTSKRAVLALSEDAAGEPMMDGSQAFANRPIQS